MLRPVLEVRHQVDTGGRNLFTRSKAFFSHRVSGGEHEDDNPDRGLRTYKSKAVARNRRSGRSPGDDLLVGRNEGSYLLTEHDAADVSCPIEVEDDDGVGNRGCTLEERLPLPLRSGDVPGLPTLLTPGLS